VRRRRRWLFSSAAALLILVLAAVIATIIVAGDEDALRARFQDVASDALGVEVRIDGPVGRGLWPAPHVSASQLQVGEADSPIAVIESVEARLAIAQLFAGRLRARSVAVAGVEIRISRDTSGRLSLQRVAHDPLRAGQLPRTRFSRLSLDYVDEGSGTHVRASGCRGRLPKLAVVRPDNADEPAWIELDGEVRCESAHWLDVDISQVEIRARARGGRLELEPIALRVFAGQGRGRVEMDFSVAPPPRSPGIRPG